MDGLEFTGGPALSLSGVDQGVASGGLRVLPSPSTSGLALRQGSAPIDLSTVRFDTPAPVDLSYLNQSIRNAALRVPTYSTNGLQPLGAAERLDLQQYLPENYFERDAIYNNPRYFISDGNQINPITGEKYEAGGVVFEGPDWLVDNQLFNNTIKQQIDRPVEYDDNGNPRHDILTDEFKQTLDSVTQGAAAIRDYRKASPGATERDAANYFRTVAAIDASDNDDKTQIIYSVDRDGNEKAMSVKSLVDTLRGMDDTKKGIMYDNYVDQLKDPRVTPSQKAVLAGILQFATQKGLLNPTGGSQARAGAESFVSGSDDGAVGWLANQATRFGQLGESLAEGGDIDFRTAAQEATDTIETDPLYNLPGLETARAIGGAAGTGVAIIADIIAANAVGGGLATASAKLASGTGKASQAARAVTGSLANLERSGNAGRVIAKTISTLPEEAVFAGLQTAANSDDYDTVKEFMIGAASNLALFSGGKTLGRVLSAIDPDASVKLAKVNDAISRAVIGGWDKFTGLPGLNKVLDKAVSGFIDSDRTARKGARKLFSSGEITKDEYKGILENIAEHRNKGRSVAREVLEFENADAYNKALQSKLNVDALGTTGSRAADEYVWAVQQKQYHDAGKIKLTESQLNSVDDAIEKGANNPQFNEYRDSIIDLETSIVDSFSRRGILDEDAIQAMRTDDAFSNGYIHMKRLIEPDWQPTVSKKFKDRQAVRRIRGGSQELASPIQAVIEHANALAEISSQNRVTDIFRQLLDSGLAQGRWLQKPEEVRQFKKLSTELAKEREAVQSLMEETGYALAIDMTKLVDDAEDIYGVANDGIGAFVDDALEDLLQAIQGEKRFQPAIKQIVSELPDDLANPERAASLEIFGAYRNDLMKAFQKQFDKTRLDREASHLIERMIRSRVDEQTQLARAEAAGEDIATESVERTPSVAENVQTEIRDVPVISTSRTMALGKPSVRGNAKAVYSTNDQNLQQIMRSSIIGAKGTAKTADEHLRALTDAGFTRGDITAIRDFAIRDADAAGSVNADELRQFINDRLNPTVRAITSDGPQTVVTDSRRFESVATPLRERNKEMKEIREGFGDVDGNPNAIPYYRDGAKGYFEVDDPVIRDYFNSTTRSAVDDGLIARTFTNSSRIFRAMTTGLNPVFAFMVNPSRDVVRATVTGGTDFLSPQSTIRMIMESTPGMTRETAEGILGRINNSIELNTRVGSSRLPDELTQQALARYRTRQASGVKEHVVALKDNAKVDKAALKKIENITLGAPENLVRKRAGAVAYAKAKARGASDEIALSNATFAAREATTNFASVGKNVQSFVRTVPYLTAAINGRASFLRMWQLDPIGVTSRLAAGIVGPSTVIAANNLKDDETAAAYFDIPEWERRANMIVMLPGGGNLKIPMDQELMAIVNPFIEQMEIMHGLDKSTADNVFRTILSASPVDLTGFADRNMQGELDPRTALTRVAGSLTPQLLQAPLELAAGRDLYTGQPLAPTDAELVDRGMNPDEITNADRTFAGRDSKTLGFIANLLGVPQGNVQNVFSNFTGGVGGMLLNSFDTIIGAPEGERGGRSLAENVARRFFGKSYSQSQQDYYAGVNDLEEDRELLKTRLERFNRMSIDNPDDPSIIAQRQAAIDSYGQKVAKFADDYGRFYQQAGGLKPFQLNSLVRLLNFAPDQGAFEPGTLEADNLRQVAFAGQEDARVRANQLGLPDTNARDMFGQLTRNDGGELSVDYGDVSRSARILQDEFYGAPERLAFEFEQMTKADKENGLPSLYEQRQELYNLTSPLFARAKGLKGDAAQAVYSEINAIQAEYVERLANRIKPLLDKYGVNVLRNNKKALEEIAKYVVVPGDYRPFESKNKQPYSEQDAEAFLTDYLGVGTINRANIPTDQRVIDAIREANTALDQGKTQSAVYKLEQAQQDINAGRNYADFETMEDIKALIARANKRR